MYSSRWCKAGKQSEESWEAYKQGSMRIWLKYTWKRLKVSSTSQNVLESAF